MKHDEVRLVSYLPSGLLLHRWNGNFMYHSGVGASSTGNNIRVRAPKGVECSDEALNYILSKHFGTELTRTDWGCFYGSMNIPTSKSNIAFRGVPLSTIHQVARGNLLADWVRSFERHSADPNKTFGYTNKRRGNNSASYDYLRGGIRVEVKTSAMRWDSYHRYWNFQFGNVIPNNFDELRLVFYTPKGIFVYLHDGVSGISNAGCTTVSTGERKVQFNGPKDVSNWDYALDHILKKTFGTPVIKCMF